MDEETLDYTMNFPNMTPPRAFLDTITEFTFGESYQANMMDCNEEEHSGGGSAIKNKWTFDEEKLLLDAVGEFYTSWKAIKDLYFKGRTTNQLKQKWKEMIKTADKQKDAERKELCLEVRTQEA